MGLREYLYQHWTFSRREGNQLVFLCPRETCWDRAGHFYVKLDPDGRGGRGFCVLCGYPPRDGGFDIYGIIGDLEGISRAEAYHKVNGDSEDFYQNVHQDVTAFFTQRHHSLRGPTNPRVLEPPKPPPPLRDPYSIWNSLFLDICTPQTGMGIRAKEYLFDRGIGRDAIKKYHLLYCEGNHVKGPENLGWRYHGRIMLPIVVDGRVQFFQGRTILGDDPKYKNSKEGVDTRYGALELLWGIEFARKRDTLVIVEGPFDAIKVIEAGFSGLALMGKGIERERLDLIRSLQPKQIVLFFDKDVLKKERIKLYEKLSGLLVPLKWTESQTQNKDAGAMDILEVSHTIRIAREMTAAERILGL